MNLAQRDSGGMCRITGSNKTTAANSWDALGKQCFSSSETAVYDTPLKGDSRFFSAVAHQLHWLFLSPGRSHITEGPSTDSNDFHLCPCSAHLD